MSNLQHYANLILTPEPVKIERTPELIQRFNSIANDIYRCPVRNSTKRSFTNVSEAVEKMAIEYALCKVAGLQMNPNEFDHTDRNTYAYDVYDPANGTKMECKRWAETWLSFYARNLSTFIKNVDMIDYLVSGKVFKTSTHFSVAFHLIADAKTFEKYVRSSKYSSKLYYDHRTAMARGDAVYRDHVYFNGEAA